MARLSPGGLKPPPSEKERRRSLAYLWWFLKRKRAAAPENTDLPEILGTPLLGEVLSATTGVWTPTPTSYTYQWKRDDDAIDGETDAAYTIVGDDSDTTISVTVTATNAHGSTSATSIGVGIPLPDITLPDVASATRLLDLQADAITASDDDPIGTWANAGTLGGSFTAAGGARPTYHTGGGHPYVTFDGTDDLMTAGAAINAGCDNLASFTIFLIYSFAAGSGLQTTISKGHNFFDADVAGWAFQGDVNFVQQNDGSSSYALQTLDSSPSLGFHVYTLEAVSRNELHIYVNGALPAQTFQGSNDLTTTSNTEPVRLMATGSIETDGIGAGDLSALMLYAPAPNQEDREAIEAWLADQYGVML